MAAKGKYSKEVRDKVADALRHGATYELAAQYAGIGHDTFHRWMKEKPEFSDAVKAAEGEGAMTWLTLIDRAAIDNWQAAAWKLERRYPLMYGRQVQEHQGAISVQVRYTNDWRGGGDGDSNA